MGGDSLAFGCAGIGCGGGGVDGTGEVGGGAVGRGLCSGYILPGHTVNMGQQHKFCVQVLKDPSQGIVAYTDILFRVYVPIDNYPVVVEFMGEGHRNCNDGAALTAALTELMANANMRLRLASLRTLAQNPLL